MTFREREEGDRPGALLSCANFGNNTLEIIEQRPHPIFGRLGMTIETLRCLACGEVMEA